MTNFGGYMGKIGLLDLSTGEMGEYPWTDEDREKYVGGKATASKIMYDTFNGTEDPLGEENIIVISTGPVTGLGGPSSNRFDISSLSPLTGISASSNCGGNFGYYLKKAGYDALVIKGRCAAPSVIHINNSTVEIEPAGEFWGMNTNQVQKELLELLSNRYRRSVKCGMAVIGPAGEHLVKYASVMSNERAAGRAGMGAVFGSKNIKAITVMGNHKITPKNKAKLDAHHEKWVNTLKSNPLTSEQMPRLGTASLVTPMQMNDQLGTKNFTAGSFADFEKICGETLAETRTEYVSGCLACPIRCTRRVKLDGEDVKGPELETLGLLGPNILNSDLDCIIRWNKEIDEMGMDSISFAQTVAWAMRANEEGLWDNGLRFGKTDNISQLIDDVAHRQGVGDEIAEGTKRLSEKYGGKDFAIHSKGLELSAYQPRRSVGMGLGYAVSNRGGCHLNGGYVIGLEGLVLHVDPLTPKGKADMCMFMQDALESISMNGQCIFTSYAMFPAGMVQNPNGLPMRLVSKLLPDMGRVIRAFNKFPEIAFFNLGLIPHSKELELCTGIKMSLGRFIRNGERSYNIERALNAKFGVNADCDTLPKQLTHVAQDPNDPRTKVPLDEMKKAYYQARGWGEDGLPGEEKLKSLGIL